MITIKKSIVLQFFFEKTQASDIYLKKLEGQLRELIISTHGIHIVRAQSRSSFSGILETINPFDHGNYLDS